MPERAEVEAARLDAATEWLAHGPMITEGYKQCRDAAVDLLSALDRVRDARGDDGETDRQRELRTGVASTTVENYRRALEDVNAMVFAHCRRLGIPLMSPPRVAEALDALAEAAARSLQGEDHEAVGVIAEFLHTGGPPLNADDAAVAIARVLDEAGLLSPSRDGTVAVQNWRTIATQLASLLRELHPQNPYYREKRDELVAAFDALAGESNEGGNQ